MRRKVKCYMKAAGGMRSSPPLKIFCDPRQDLVKMREDERRPVPAAGNDLRRGKDLGAVRGKPRDDKRYVCVEIEVVGRSDEDVVALA